MRKSRGHDLLHLNCSICCESVNNTNVNYCSTRICGGVGMASSCYNMHMGSWVEIVR